MSESAQELRTARGMSKGITIMLVAAALAFGGVAVARAATSGSTVTVCANKATGALRYSKGGACRSTESKLLLGQTGPTGVTGVTGAAGATGATGPSGSASPVTINSLTGTTYTLVLADAGKIITSSSTAANVITIPANSSVEFPVGTKIEFGQVGAGAIILAPATGVTLNGGSAVVGFDSGSYQHGILLKIATNTWLLLLPKNT